MNGYNKWLTSLSSASNFKYLCINDIIELIGLLPSTAHLRFFIIGTFPVALRSMSTTDNKIWSEIHLMKTTIRAKSTFCGCWLFVAVWCIIVDWRISFDWHFFLFFIFAWIIHCKLDYTFIFILLKGYTFQNRILRTMFVNFIIIIDNACVLWKQ